MTKIYRIKVSQKKLIIRFWKNLHCRREGAFGCNVAPNYYTGRTASLADKSLYKLEIEPLTFRTSSLTSTSPWFFMILNHSEEICNIAIVKHSKTLKNTSRAGIFKAAPAPPAARSKPVSIHAYPYISLGAHHMHVYICWCSLVMTRTSCNETRVPRSVFFSKIKFTHFWILWSYKHIFLIAKMNIFLGVT